MLTKKEFKKATDFQTHLEEQLKDPEFKKYYDEFGTQLEVAYAILQLRKKAKLSQSELAKKIGTSQGNVARIESGNENVTVELLHRIAKATKRDLKIEFIIAR
ncbi:MAG TPA: helix-turn-helix transcriptional regulator [Patescibacteria group bacterium]